MHSNLKTHNRKVFALTAAMWLACTLVVSNAFADDTRSETVRFSDLNVGTPAGVQSLYGRIHAAALRVCEQPSGEMEAVRSCVAKAEHGAIAKANLPLLTAFYQSKTGTQPATIIASR